MHFTFYSLLRSNAPPPPAGYGAVAIQGGVGEIFRIGGQITKGRTPNVKTTTQNLAAASRHTRDLH